MHLIFDFDSVHLQVLDQVSQTQNTVKATSNRLTRDMQNHLMSIKLLNQSLERYLDRVEGWKDVIEETEEKMKTLTEDQYDVKATAQQVNMTVALRCPILSFSIIIVTHAPLCFIAFEVIFSILINYKNTFLPVSCYY